jgi:anhydro-N-acetylmuramic acid kinase
LPPRELYIGLMSGTSLDGVDAILADFGGDARDPKLMASAHTVYDDALRADLLELHHTGHNELDRAALLGIRVDDHYATAVAEVVRRSAVSVADITAIGCHGQTVRHRPELGYTIQLANPARLAEATGIAVVADFRSRDIAAGGQGAPLAPAFHRAVFARPDRHRVVANIGGIANLTNLAPGQPVIGFDCGPGNMLMDAWILKSRGERYDNDGTWAREGKLVPELLELLLGEPFLRLPPPKSTGRDLFSSAWLAPKLRESYRAVDVQASLLEFTAEALGRAVKTHCRGAQELLLCGGGARNSALREHISKRLHPVLVNLSDVAGIAAEHVEAMAFAWLARQTIHGEAGNLAEVTGARGPRVLGAIYPA